MSGRAQIRMLPDGRRLHMQDGPIDLIVEGFGEEGEIECAYHAAGRRFVTVLYELCSELTFLRQPTMIDGPQPDGSVARRMADAVLPYAPTNFITPMAAVAGAVAEEILEAMTSAAKLSRAYVNDGGDIALHMTAGETFVVGMVERPDRAMNPTFRKPRNVGHPLFGTTMFGSTTIDFEQPVRGIATSGWRGRSFSLGIADAVTVLADTASMADAAATIIANAVDLPGSAKVGRVRACDLAPDSDLGERLVTQSVGQLSWRETCEALAAGERVAESLRLVCLIRSAALNLQGEIRVVGAETGSRLFGISSSPNRSLVHA
jgi:uncharacterized protein